MGIFGNSDSSELLQQILSQLGQIDIRVTQLGTDLAVTKQQITDQQHAIDRIRQDTTSAINNGLSESRADIRNALTQNREAVSDPLTQIGSELGRIRDSLTQLDERAQAAATAPPPPSPQEREAETATSVEDHTPDVESPPDPGKRPTVDEHILRAAAGISAATLHAHRDTWEFLVKHAGQDQHFHLPGAATIDDGAVEVAVSGPTLVATLTSLAAVSRTADDPGTAAIAGHLHDRLTETVQALIDNPHRGDGANKVDIVIDDRAASRNSEDGEQPDNE